jgi:hypothetical protein
LQKYCSQAACRTASKQASQRRWLAQPKNAEYFCGALHVSRVQAWRAARRRRLLQEPRASQVDDRSMKSGALALQETSGGQGVDAVVRQGGLAPPRLQDVM